MVIMLLALLLAILAIPCILMPEQLWRSFNVGDDDASYALQDYNLVAHRNPVRESGPPVCMAKLIMLRHKIHQSGGQRKRSRSQQARHSRSLSRTNAHLSPPRQRSFAWMKFGKQMH